MKKNFFLMICLSLAVLIMYACGKDDLVDPEEEQAEQKDPDPEIPDDPGGTGDNDLNPNSQNISYENAVSIAFSDRKSVV